MTDMFSLLHMDFYRLVKSRSFWICMGVILALTMFAVGMMWSITTPQFADMLKAADSNPENSGIVVGVSGLDEEDAYTLSNPGDIFEGMNQIHFLGNLLINGGFLGLVISLFIALFVAAEFESGFIKNVFTAKTSRAGFFASKFILIIAVVTVFSLVGIGATLGCVGLAGLNVTPVPFSELAVWSGLVILTMSALSMLVSLLVWFFRGKVVGVLAATFLSTGLIMSIVQMVLSLIPSLSHVVDYTLFGCWNALSKGLDVAGSLGTPHIFLVGGVFLVLYSILSYFTLKKKDV